MERINPIKDRIFGIHDHLMDKGPAVSSGLGAVTFLGGLLKQDVVSLAGGLVVFGLSISIKSWDDHRNSKNQNKK